LGTYIHIDSQNTLGKPNYITRKTIEPFSVLFFYYKNMHYVCKHWIHMVKDLREYLSIFLGILFYDNMHIFIVSNISPKVVTS